MVELQHSLDMPGFNDKKGLMEPPHINRVMHLSNGGWRRKGYFMLSAYGVGGLNLNLMGGGEWQV